MLEGADGAVGASVFLRFGMPHQLLVEPGIANVNYTMFEADRKQPAAVEKQALNEHAEPERESSTPRRG